MRCPERSRASCNCPAPAIKCDMMQGRRWRLARRTTKPSETAGAMLLLPAAAAAAAASGPLPRPPSPGPSVLSGRARTSRANGGFCPCKIASLLPAAQQAAGSGQRAASPHMGGLVLRPCATWPLHCGGLAGTEVKSQQPSTCDGEVWQRRAAPDERHRDVATAVSWGLLGSQQGLLLQAEAGETRSLGLPQCRAAAGRTSCCLIAPDAGSHDATCLLVVQQGEAGQVSACWRRARLQPAPIQDAVLQRTRAGGHQRWAAGAGLPVSLQCCMGPWGRGWKPRPPGPGLPAAAAARALRLSCR